MKSSVPVLPFLWAILENYEHHLEGLPEEGNLGKTLKPHDWIFAGKKRGTSLNLPNLVRRTIVPLLTRCLVCGAAKHVHINPGHPFEPDPSIPKWKGWHSFVRSLASNLYALGVKPKVIQAKLRHSDINTTLGYYVEVPEAETREALEQLQSFMTPK